VAVLVALVACMSGGANVNQKQVGDEPGGVQLAIGDIAVAPFGDYVVFQRGETLAVGFVESGSISALPVTKPTRLAFSKTRPVVYVGTAADQAIVAVDVEQGGVLWSTRIDETSTSALRLAASSDDSFVVAGTTSRVQVLDGETGSVRNTVSLNNPLVDLKILPDNGRALIVERHTWENDAPQTRVDVVDLETGETTVMSVPNCSDRVAVTPDGRRAFLAPTTCQTSLSEVKDPVSVIELTRGSERFNRNLPGFGPVALAPDGALAVAFLDAFNVDVSLFDDPDAVPWRDGERYHLMLMDTGTLGYDFVPVGESLPRFAVTPDGNVLLVDSDWAAGDQVRVFDVPSRTFRWLSGPKVKLDNFALTSDSRHAYLLYGYWGGGDLYDVDIAGGVVARIPTDFTPQNINISADDRLLFLRKSDHEICIFEIAKRSCRGSFVQDEEMLDTSG
jgi:outer membrane protein assembly factor BamB